MSNEINIMVDMDAVTSGKVALMPIDKFKYIQPESFKNISPENMTKLKNNLKDNEWSGVIFAWRDEDSKEVYCLDGHHRLQALLELEQEGYVIPRDIPTVFIKCKNKDDAAKKILAFSSTYAKVQVDSLQDFFDSHNLEFDSLADEFTMTLESDMIGEISFAGFNIVKGYDIDINHDDDLSDIAKPTINKAPKQVEKAPDKSMPDKEPEKVPVNKSTPTSHVRMAALYFNEAQFDEYNKYIDAGKKRYGTDTSAETVLCYLRDSKALEEE